MATAAQVRAAFESALGTRIETLASEPVPSPLINLPGRLTQKVLDEYRKLLERLEEVGAGPILQDQDATTKIFQEIDDGKKFLLSKAAFKGQRLDWARQEGDKARLIWGYYERSLGAGGFSHCTTLQLMRLKRARHSPSPESLPESLPAPSALQDLPEPPESDEDSFDLPEPTAMASTPKLARANASEVLDLTGDDDISCPPSLEACASHVQAMEPVDHAAHKSLFKKPGAAPKTLAAVMQRPDGPSVMKRPDGPGSSVKKRPASNEVSDTEEGKGECDDKGEETLETGSYHLMDYADRMSTQFQTALRNGSDACGHTYGCRPFKSKLVISFQYGCYILQVKDPISKLAVGMVSARQCPNLRAAEMAGYVLLALYDCGADRKDLQAVKRSGAFGFKCGRATGEEKDDEE